MICHLGYIKQFDCPSIRYKQKTLKIHTYNIYYIYMHNIVIPIWDQFLKEQKHTFFFFMKSHTNYNVIYRVVPCDMCNLIRNYMTRKII